MIKIRNRVLFFFGLCFHLLCFETFGQNRVSPASCDSTIYNKLHIAMQEFKGDSLQKLVVDSSSSSVIAGHKGYDLRDYSFNVRKDVFPLLISESPLCDIKKYVYFFELLLDSGLDFSYDYYTIYIPYEKGGRVFATNRTKSKEFQYNKRLIKLFFETYKMYSNNVYRKDDHSYEDMLEQVLKYSCLKYPVMTTAIMKGSPGLTEDEYRRKEVNEIHKRSRPGK